MLTIIIGLVAAGIIGAIFNVLLHGTIWTVVGCTIGFFATTILLNLWVKKQLEAVFNGIQSHVEEMQDQMRRRINMMQAKNIGGGKGLQKRMEKEQATGIREALKELDKVAPLQKWNILAARQANTLRAQLYYQIKEFDRADECFEKCFIMDPLTLAMRIARYYAHDKMDEVEKAFKKGIKRHKDEKGIILYALYSWILVKKDRIDDAVALLNEAKGKTEDETLRTNWEHLANSRVRRFSNAGLGDQWYALHLETPKPIKSRQRYSNRRR